MPQFPCEFFDKDIDHITTVSTNAVIKVSASSLQDLDGGSAIVLDALREKCAAATASLALPFACGIQWFDLKKVAEERRKLKEDGKSAELGMSTMMIRGSEKFEGAGMNI
ncbi:hypothetical protein NHQ30_007763 [Ciborinia camelliae]|nr:hypothetical protein NHQ30_007763 [Ciborinia camelliae]